MISAVLLIKLPISSILACGTQIWRLTGEMKLENGKEGKWKFDDKVWIVPPEGEISYIKDWSSGKVLGISNIVSETEKLVVLQSEADPLSDNQKWLRSHYDEDGFFTLTNPSSGKILTASGVTKLTIKGWL